MRAIFTTILLLGTFISKAQVDTLRVMQYNLLNYGNYFSGCTTSNNHVDDKDDYLRTILDYVKPDVFTINELGVDFQGLENVYGERILDSTLNINGVTKYAKAEHTGGSYLVNMIYYNTEKLVFHSQDYISNDANSNNLVREIDFYTLYHNDPNLSTHNDTVFVTFVVAHLKAGSGQSDQDDRAAASLAVMGYLNNNDGAPGNRFLCGDFNVKGDTELGYSHFLNYSNADIRFQDPIDEPGYWGGEWDFRYIHTQSTHDNVQTGDCPSGGGLDDRFDFILTTQSVMWGESGVSYIANSYDALGNDGSSYNSDLNTVSNTSVPPSVATALFNMSDHLPIVMDVKISKDLVNGIFQPVKEQLSVEYNNPIVDQLTVRVPNDMQVETLSVFDINGNLVYSNNGSSNTHFVIDTERFAAGTYVLSVSSKEGQTGNYKLVKF